MRDMACGGSFFTEMLLNAIFFVATKDLPSLEGRCPATDSCGEGMVFRAKLEAALFHVDGQLICKSTITTVQALLLVSDALYSWCDEKSLSWHHLGLAINMILI